MAGNVRLQNAVRLVGEYGVRWLLAVELDDVELHEATLSAEQLAALELLEAVIERAQALAGPSADERSSLVGQQLVGHPSVSEIPPALLIRTMSGGRLPVPPAGGEPLECGAAKMALQLLGAYVVDPTLTADPIGLRFWASMRFGDPAVVDWCAAVLADPEFGEVFGGPREGWTPDDLDCAAFWWDSTGRGGSMQLALLPSAICDSVATRLWCEDSFAAQRFVDGVVDAVEQMRRLLVMGRRVKVQATVGVAGLKLPPGVAMTIDGETTVRAASALERQLLKHVGGDQIEVVITSPFDFRIRPGDDDPSDWLEEHGRTARAALDTAVVRIRAAAVLALRRFEVGVVAVAGTVIHTPLAHAPAMMGYVGRPATALYELTADDAQRVGSVVVAMENTSLSRIDVAIRRLLSALERPTATDGFIDAVIGWDNLFGSREGDSTLRISLSFAYLLGGDAREDRQTLRAEVKAAYGKRSDVVHGAATELELGEAFALRNRAIALLADALETLIVRRPDLLAYDGSGRSNELIIGVDREQ